MDMELQNKLFDKIIYLTGYFKGIANVLRSSGNVDPLALSSDFESISKDMQLIQDTLMELLESDDDFIESCVNENTTDTFDLE